MHVLYDDTVKAINDTVNDTVFNLVTQNSKITATEISRHLKISLSTTKRKIKELKEEGYIERLGSDKTGSWKIIKKL
jgi:predicted HTH transcriptional regulator